MLTLILLRSRLALNLFTLQIESSKIVLAYFLLNHILNCFYSYRICASKFLTEASKKWLEVSWEIFMASEKSYIICMNWIKASSKTKVSLVFFVVVDEIGLLDSILALNYFSIWNLAPLSNLDYMFRSNGCCSDSFPYNFLLYQETLWSSIGHSSDHRHKVTHHVLAFPMIRGLPPKIGLKFLLHALHRS